VAIRSFEPLLSCGGSCDTLMREAILMGVWTKTWTREEYELLVHSGVFTPEARVQLVLGEIVEMTPQTPAHATAVRRLQKVMESVFRSGFDVRAQLPLALGERSEPEPDIAVVPGSPEDYRTHHPSAAVLVIEVSDTTLEFDRTRKLSMYAQNGIPEYWILNLAEGTLEVYRDPQGMAYRTALRLGPHEAVSPLAAPLAQVAVGDLLP
jgi:Uma2 family endonuclease